jgi:hypothetical protein
MCPLKIKDTLKNIQISFDLKVLVRPAAAIKLVT